jgi:lipopolysaccharide transport system ATP-binding protein
MENGTVLFVSHDTASVKNLCDRAIWIEKGRLMADGDPKSVSDAYLKYLYGTSEGTQIPKQAQGSAHPLMEIGKPKASRDMRQDFLNASILRNDIQIFQMNEQYKGFGRGGVSLIRAALEDEAGNPLSWVVGGETVQIKVEGQSNELIEEIIVGFTVKDKLGQYLFSDNTYLTYCEEPLSVPEHESFNASFRFVMPILRAGDYTIDIAVASGTQKEHVQQLWVQDALVLKSVTSSVCTGLMGIPIENISLKVE